MQDGLQTTAIICLQAQGAEFSSFLLALLFFNYLLKGFGIILGYVIAINIFFLVISFHFYRCIVLAVSHASLTCV